MATKKKSAASAQKTPVVVAAEPVLEKPKTPSAAPVAKAPPKAPPATKAAAAKVASRPAAKAKPVEEQVQASKAALAAALEKAKAVKLTPRAAAPAKAAKSAKPARVEKPAKPAKPAKAPKVKLVRDSFTMPENEYAALALLKKRLHGFGVAAKKSELLRAGVALLAALKDGELAAALAKVEKIKTGRPAKSGK